MNDPPATPSDSAVQRIAIDRAQRPVQARFHARIQRRTVGALLLTGDLALLAACVLMTLPWHRIVNDPVWLAASLALVAAPLLALYVVGGYRTEAIARTGRMRHFVFAALAGTLGALLAYKGALLWLHQDAALRFTFRSLAAPVLVAIWAVATRSLARAILLRRERSARIIAIGAPVVTADLEKLVRASHCDAPLCAIDPQDSGAAARLDTQLDGMVHAIVLDQPRGGLGNDLLEALVHARLAGVPVVPPGELVEELQERTPVGLGDPGWMIGSDRLRSGSSMYLGLKRLLDLAVAVPLLVVLLPVMLGTAIAVKLTSPGPALFTQRREGLYKRLFTIIKFRTMRTDAEKHGAQWATTNDPRVTPIGAFLRKSRLDELPQLINVIAGDMSLVGPRPERPEFNCQLVEKIPWYDLRHLAKPGLTGWAQVRYPYGASVEDAIAKLEFEIYYLKYASTAFDLRILLRTISVVLGLRGR